MWECRSLASRSIFCIESLAQICSDSNSLQGATADTFEDITQHCQLIPVDLLSCLKRLPLWDSGLRTLKSPVAHERFFFNDSRTSKSKILFVVSVSQSRIVVVWGKGAKVSKGVTPPAKYEEYFHHVIRGLISMQPLSCWRQQPNTGGLLRVQFLF